MNTLVTIKYLPMGESEDAATSNKVDEEILNQILELQK